MYIKRLMRLQRFLEIRHMETIKEEDVSKLNSAEEIKTFASQLHKFAVDQNLRRNCHGKRHSCNSKTRILSGA